VGRMIKRFGREDSESVVRKHELNRVKERESEVEMENFDNDDEDDLPLEEHDGSEDWSD
jgi:hypothetical protein